MSTHHRGAHPADAALFSAQWHPTLALATAELSWLLTRGYAMPSALKLVGDRHELRERQRTAISRAACGAGQAEARRQKEISLRGESTPSFAGKELAIDGFNLLVTIECALSGGILFTCQDGCIRDLASVHGSYRRVEETGTALDLIGRVLDEIRPSRVLWLLDTPVSNSGRLATIIRNKAETADWPWEVQLVMNPDTELIRWSTDTKGTVITADSLILDHCASWLNLTAWMVERGLLSLQPIALGQDPL